MAQKGYVAGQTAAFDKVKKLWLKQWFSCYCDLELYARSLYHFRFKSYGSNSGFHVFVTLTYIIFVISQNRHDVLESPYNFSQVLSVDSMVFQDSSQSEQN